MGKKFKYPRGTKKRLLLEQKALGKTVTEARAKLKEQDINVNLSYAYDVFNPKPETPPTTEQVEEIKQEPPQQEQVEITENEIPIPELTATNEPLPPELQKLKDSIEKGTFTKEELVGLFEIINDYFNQFGYQKYRPPKSSSELLAAAWVKVLNDKLKTMTEKDDNVPIYAAIAITLIVYFPRLGLIVAEKMKQKPKKEPLKDGLEAEAKLDKS